MKAMCKIYRATRYTRIILSWFFVEKFVLYNLISYFQQHDKPKLKLQIKTLRIFYILKPVNALTHTEDIFFYFWPFVFLLLQYSYPLMSELAMRVLEIIFECSESFKLYKIWVAAHTHIHIYTHTHTHNISFKHSSNLISYPRKVRTNFNLELIFSGNLFQSC